MDIGKIVVYEHIHELVVTYPNSEIKTGLTMGIRSASSEQCKAVMRRHTNAQAQANRAKQKKITAEELEQNELEQTAASIAWWKWEKGDSGEDANYNGTKPELNMSLAIKLLGEINWLYAQVKEAGQNLENFMPKTPNASGPISPSLSSSTPPVTKTVAPDVNGTKPSVSTI